MRILLVPLALLVTGSPSAAQIPDLPTLGASWTDVGYPKLFYTPRNGLSVGLHYAQVRPPGFDDWDAPPPYRAALSVDGQLSTSGSKKLTLAARFPSFFPGWRVGLVFEAERDARQNYFGIGNRSAFDSDLINDAQPHFYQSDHRRTFLRGEIQRRLAGGLRLLAGFHVERWRLDTLDGASRLARDRADQVNPYIDVSVSDVSARFGLVFDTRDDEIQTHRGVNVEIVVAAADSQVAGDVTYRRVFAAASGYLPLGDRFVVAARVIGQAMTGAPPLGSYYLIEAGTDPFDALGGARSHRGLQEHRFLGEDKLFGNLEARYAVAGDRQVGGVVLVGFLDVGRVFQPGEDDFRLTLRGHHVGGGLGPMLNIGRTGVLGATLGLGPDGVIVHAHTRWAF